MPWRESPEQLLRAMVGATLEQKSSMRLSYHHVLDSYELGNWTNNVAVAVAYAVRMSLEITRGQAVSPAESNYLVAYMNDPIANVPQSDDDSATEATALRERHSQWRHRHQLHRPPNKKLVKNNKMLPRRRNLWVTDTLQWAPEARLA